MFYFRMELYPVEWLVHMLESLVGAIVRAREVPERIWKDLNLIIV